MDFFVGRNDIDSLKKTPTRLAQVVKVSDHVAARTKSNLAHELVTVFSG
jgi:hypothetical protein